MNDPILPELVPFILEKNVTFLNITFHTITNDPATDGWAVHTCWSWPKGFLQPSEDTFSPNLLNKLHGCAKEFLKTQKLNVTTNPDYKKDWKEADPLWRDSVAELVEEMPDPIYLVSSLALQQIISHYEAIASSDEKRLPTTAEIVINSSKDVPSFCTVRDKGARKTETTGDFDLREITRTSQDVWIWESLPGAIVLRSNSAAKRRILGRLGNEATDLQER